MQNGDSIYRTPPGDCLSKVQLPRINVTEISECNNVLSEKELYMFFMSMQNNTSPGNSGLTKDFFIILWEELNLFVSNSCRIAKLKKQLTTWQRQAVIKLI